MSFTQELKELAQASEGMDPEGSWREVLHLHRELGRAENTLGRAGFTMRYGQRGEWRRVLREAAAETLREARRAASVYDIVRLREVAGAYVQLAGSPYPDAAALMLKPGERSGGRATVNRRQPRFDRVAADVHWTVEPPTNGRRRREDRRSRRRRERRLQPEAA